MNEAKTGIEQDPPVTNTLDIPAPDDQVTTGERLSQLSYQMRLVLLGAALVAGLVLYSVSPGINYFIAATMALMALLAVSFLVDARQRSWVAGSAVALMHLAWIVFALHFTGYLDSPLLPLLYVIVVIYSMYGRKQETGLVVAGAVVALFVEAFVLRVQSSEVLLTVASHAVLLTAISWAINKYMSWLYEAQDSAEREAHTYRHMTETSDEALLVLDTRWHIRQFNAAAVNLLSDNGHSPELRGKHLFDVLQLHHPEGIKPYQQQVLDGQTISEVPLVTTAPDGEPRELLFSALPLLEGDRITAIHTAMRDVTDLSEFRQELRHLEKFVAVRHVLESLGHTLNNPLAIIRLAIQVSQAIGEEPDWDEIIRQVDRCDAAIRGLEIYTTGRDEGIPVIDVKKMISQALLLTKAQLMITGVEFQLDIPPNLPLAHANRHSLYHSFVNVITYAWQNMEDWPGARKLSIEARRRAEGVEISFRSTGPSVEASQIPQLLKGAKTASMSDDEFGQQVGLPAVYGTVQRAGGQILVSPNRREGGTFIKIILPTANEEDVKQYELSHRSVNE